MEFQNILDPEKFRSTNGPRNDLCLNDPWSVSYISTLIETQDFKNKEDWEQYYYDSGEERNKQLSKLSQEGQNILNNHVLKHTNPEIIDKIPWNIKNLNFQYGRTKTQMVEKGKILFDYVTAKCIDISLEECIECVRFRTICETWNGIIVRERNTIAHLKQVFPNLDFVKVPWDLDHKYWVDYEIKQSEKLACAIQIKPKSYTGNTPFLKKAQNSNRQKNEEYFKIYGKPVLYIFSQTNWTILNTDILKEIQNYIYV